ncbi:MAG: putative hydrolase [Candidatus Moanabacter tarae]|uniref:Putative hydrolase n=1 Tax=Candidatus Moanibacter tarae TaxID=2200854 RepID=A0A2Z4AE00_9BACT|nr:MAG: putative hydrolase [Candidatus Moanabacter tarae]
MEILKFELPPIGTNAYLLLNEASRKAVLFDAPLEAWSTFSRVLKDKKCELEALYLTHGHWDHILDVAKFAKQGVKIYGHREDECLIRSPARMADFAVPGIEISPGRVDHFLEDGDQIEILGNLAEVRHVPGHSAGSILFFLPGLRVSFSGDAIFAGSIGRTDFPGCSFELLAKSIREKIYTLPDETIIYPGHGPETTVGEEKRNNPFLRG